jgi:hypothetical protein
MKLQFVSLVVIFFILINTDLSEAKGGRRRFHVSSHGSGAGGSIKLWQILLYVIGGLAPFIVLMCFCCCCSDFFIDCTESSLRDYPEENLGGINRGSTTMHENHQHQQRNETAINMQPMSQFQENLPQDSPYGTKLSPDHLSYSISPVNVPQNGQNPANYISETVPQPQPTAPLGPENHNLKTHDNFQNGPILSPGPLPYSLTNVAVPPPYPSNQSEYVQRNFGGHM